MTAMGMVSFFEMRSRAMAERNSPTLVVDITSPASMITMIHVVPVERIVSI